MADDTPDGTVFGLPSCPDDMEAGIDAEGSTWTLQTDGPWRGWWERSDGKPLTWPMLIWNHGPIKKVARNAP